MDKGTGLFSICAAVLSIRSLAAATRSICIVDQQANVDDSQYGRGNDSVDDKRGEYVHIGDPESELETFGKPLPCCGCGIGWFSFLLGFLCPVLWYASTILYLGSYYHKDPRERSGLAACAIAALVCTISVAIALLVILL